MGRHEDGTGGEGRRPVAGPYQEGRVESLHEVPTGRDAGDRTGEGDRPGEGRREEGRSSDSFLSSEVDEKSRRPGGADSGPPDKTRS